MWKFNISFKNQFLRSKYKVTLIWLNVDCTVRVFIISPNCLRTLLKANTKTSNRFPITSGSKAILYMGFRATLNFRKFKMALNLIYRIYLNFAKSYILSCLSKFYYKKKFTMLFLKYKRLKAKSRVFFEGHSVAMVTYCVTKIIPTCSPVIGQFVFRFHDCSINWLKVVMMTHQNLSLGMCWK